MRDPIFLRHADGSLVRMERTPYDSEDLLQTLLADYPDLLAGDRLEPGEPRRWLLVSREAGVPAEKGGGTRWSLDHLFLDQDAIPTLVEVKRSSDTRIRREVVGQMLDYAAHAAEHWSMERIRTLFERTCEQLRITPEASLQELLGETADPDAYWTEVETNLEAGRMRLVFVADEIPPELERIIEYLNGQMERTTVVGVEVPQFVCGELQTLVPRVVGLTMEARTRKGSGRSRSRIAPEQLIDAFGGAGGAVSTFLSQCERQGLSVLFGDTGCSVRMKLPDRSKPSSVAWLFPPGVTGWMGLTGITVGCERAMLSPDEPLAPAFQDYLEAISRLPGAQAGDKGYVATFEIPAERAAEQLPIILERIAELRDRVEAIRKSDPI